MGKERVGGVVARNAGDFVMINGRFEREDWEFGEGALANDVHSRLILEHTVVHEAAHATHNLLSATAGLSQFKGQWEPTTSELAEKGVEKMRAREGVLRVWSRLQRSFEDVGWSGGYADQWAGPNVPPFTDIRQAYADELKELSPKDLAANGFMSAYAGLSIEEDFAENASQPIIGPLLAEAGIEVGSSPFKNDYGCIAMQESDVEGVPQNLAAVYAKQSLMRGLGIVTEDNFQRCIGEATQLPEEDIGISIYEDGEYLRTFDEDWSAGIAATDTAYVFQVESYGTALFGENAYGAKMELTLHLGPKQELNEWSPDEVLIDRVIDKVSWPRGVFPMTPTSPHKFELTVPEEPAADFYVYDGVMLLAEATNERIIGSIVVKKGFRPNSPVPVPQVFDPPMQFRVYLERGAPSEADEQ